MRQDFGSSLDFSLFENAADAADIIEKAVTIAFNKWLPSLNLIEVTPQYDTTNGFMDITLRYSLPSGAADEVTVNTAIFSRSGDLIQEITRG
jgi:phage baseplate assembly protein W